jgi:hypothetical protein
VKPGSATPRWTTRARASAPCGWPVCE